MALITWTPAPKLLGLGLRGWLRLGLIGCAGALLVLNWNLRRAPAETGGAGPGGGLEVVAIDAVPGGAPASGGDAAPGSPPTPSGTPASGGTSASGGAPASGDTPAPGGSPAPGDSQAPGSPPAPAAGPDEPSLVNDGWYVRNMATAHGAFVIEVEAEDPEQTEAISRALVEPIKAGYAEILVYINRLGDDSDLPARRVQWTPRDGYVELSYDRPETRP